jgi:pyruvate ferredoxin oxidoreductase delta subunit
MIVTSISYPKEGAMGKTGSWRVFKPVFNKDKCVKCLRCWIFCPEGAVIRNKDGTIEY